MISNENIKVILNVAELGNIQKTADTLGYTHSGVSYIVNSVEKELGIRIFHRKYGGVELTNDGRSLIPWMRQINNSENALLNRAEELRDLNAGTIRIAAFNSAAVHILPDMVKRFKDKYPRINIEFIFTEDDAEIQSMIDSGTADLGFMVRRPGEHAAGYDVAKIPVVAMVANDHPLADGNYFPICKLSDYPFIAPMKPLKGSWAGDFLLSKGADPIVSLTVENDYCAMALASLGLGYCIYPEMLAKDLAFPLKCLPFDEPEYREIYIAVRSEETCTHSARAFINAAFGGKCL